MHNMESEKLSKTYTNALEKLGEELLEIQFDFKIKNKPSEEYWANRTEQFKKYHEKVLEYFTQGYSFMNLINKEDSSMFLLKISKLKQLGLRLIECMEEVKRNPAVMDLKDRQQSKWSIIQRENLINSNNDCLNQEKHMNIFFREFFEKNRNDQ